MSILDTKDRRFEPQHQYVFSLSRDFIRIASVDLAVKWVPGGDNLVKGVQCYELFGGIALKKSHFFVFTLWSRDIWHTQYVRQYVLFCLFSNTKHLA